MPLKRYVLILFVLFGLLVFIALQLNSVAAQEPSGITITPSQITEVPPTTEVPPPPTTVVPPTTEVPPPPTTVVPPTTEVVTPTTPVVTFPPPFDATDTPTPTDGGGSRNRASGTPPVLPSTGQSPVGGGFLVEALFAVVLLVLVGWFLVRGVSGSRSEK